MVQFYLKWPYYCTSTFGRQSDVFKCLHKWHSIQVDYEQSLFFLSPSSKTPETRKWPRTWLKARFSRLAASPLNARARVHSPY